jgi:hypothetical protein
LIKVSSKLSKRESKRNQISSSVKYTQATYSQYQSFYFYSFSQIHPSYIFPISENKEPKEYSNIVYCIDDIVYEC